MKELYKEPVWDEERRFWHRGPADIFVGDEQKSYKALKQGAPYDSVLDIGAHIGWFTRYAKQELGAKMVTAVEPDPASAKLYRLNHKPKDYASLVAFHEAAVVSDGRKELDLQLSHKYPANNRTDRPIQGRHTVKVKTIDFHDLLIDVKPDLLKIDIEGAEYYLELDPLPDSVRAIAIEYHQFDTGMLEDQNHLHRFFLDCGFAPVTMPKMKQTFQKITTGVYLR